MGPIETTQAHRLEPVDASPIEPSENTMNMKKTGIASLFAVLSLGALSAQAQDSVPAHSYMYGEHLDIARALSTEVDATPTCGLVNTHLNYVDSHGQKRTLSYRTIAQDCARDN